MTELLKDNIAQVIGVEKSKLSLACFPHCFLFLHPL